MLACAAASKGELSTAVSYLRTAVALHEASAATRQSPLPSTFRRCVVEAEAMEADGDLAGAVGALKAAIAVA